MATGALRYSFEGYPRLTYAAILAPSGQFLDQVLKRTDLHASSYKSSRPMSMLYSGSKNCGQCPDIFIRIVH